MAAMQMESKPILVELSWLSMGLLAIGRMASSMSEAQQRQSGLNP